MAVTWISSALVLLIGVGFGPETGIKVNMEEFCVHNRKMEARFVRHTPGIFDGFYVEPGSLEERSTGPPDVIRLLGFTALYTAVYLFSA